MSKTTENGKKLMKLIYELNLSFEDLIQIFELTGDMLDVKSRSDFGNENKISYNGVPSFTQARKNLKYSERWNIKKVYSYD